MEVIYLPSREQSQLKYSRWNCRSLYSMIATSYIWCSLAERCGKLIEGKGYGFFFSIKKSVDTVEHI